MNNKLIRAALAALILGPAAALFTGGAAFAQSGEDPTEDVVVCEVTEEDGSTSIWEVDSAQDCEDLGGVAVSGN